MGEDSREVKLQGTVYQLDGSTTNSKKSVKLQFEPSTPSTVIQYGT